MNLELCFGLDTEPIFSDCEGHFSLPVNLPSLLYYLEHSKNDADFDSGLLDNWLQLQKDYLEAIETVINERKPKKKSRTKLDLSLDF